MAVSTRSKHAVTVAAVARRLLTVPVGARIPSISELSHDAQAGSGTVQAAIHALRDAGAVELASHGHLGTTLVDRDLGELWAATGHGPVEGFLPLPTSMEFAGLATALAETFGDAGIPVSLSFAQGVSRRFESLERGRTDFVACSVAAARRLPPAEHRVVPLPEHTFYSQNAVVVITRGGEQPDPRGRVPIDHHSHDHVALTEAEFPHARFLDAAYMQIPELIVRGEADAAVWHRTSASPLLVATGLSLHPLSRPASADIEEISRAALVTRAGDEARDAILDAVIDPERIAAIQADVLANRRVPTF
jgi:hypothetical protein